jgi:hypothetical protein
MPRMRTHDEHWRHVARGSTVGQSSCFVKLYRTPVGETIDGDSRCN